MRGTVLVVDDREDLCELFARTLTQEGFRVMTARSGREALVQVELEPPDLILLDLIMPEMNGIETLRWLRKRAGEVKVVILTGYGTDQYVREAMALGVSGFLGKPFDLDRLCRIVAEEVEEKALLVTG